MPRMVASDLDGTLLRSDKTVSPTTLAALDDLSDAGIPFVMVTGRPIRWLAPVIEQVGHRGPIVCGNGSVVVDERAENVLAEWLMPPELLAAIVEAVNEISTAAVFAVERGRHMLHEPHYPVLPGPMSAHEESALLDEVVAQSAPKLLIRLTKGDADEFYREVTDHIAGLATLTHSGFPGLIEVTAPEVDKTTGLAWVADYYGVEPSDVLAFGDMPNDRAMLTWAGRSVAVADAHPDAMEIADTVTLGNDADGVAAYLRHFLDRAA